jgi:O-antigen/teichoic acid export membrane protein
MTISTLIVLMGWLLPQYGILGATIAIFVSYSVGALSTLAFLYQLNIVKFRTHILYPNTIFTLVIITFFICSSMIGNFIAGIVSLYQSDYLNTQIHPFSHTHPFDPL